MDEEMFYIPSDATVSRLFNKGTYPIPFPGNIKPTKKPDFSTLVLYQIMRGKNLNHSFRRMVKMMYDIDDVEMIVREFVTVQNSNPDVSGYLNLAKAYANVRNLNYDYSDAEFGNQLRVWGKDNEEWTFDIRRGKYRERDDYNVDYAKLLNVRKVDMLTFRNVSKSRSDLVKPFRKKKSKK